MKSSKILIMSVLIILSSFSNEISAQTTESTVKNDTIAFVFKKTSDDLKNNIAKLKDAGKKSKKFAECLVILEDKYEKKVSSQYFMVDMGACRYVVFKQIP